MRTGLRSLSGAAATLLLLVAASLAGCASSTSPGGGGTTSAAVTTAPASTSPATATSGTKTTASGGATSSASAKPAMCLAPQLTASLGAGAGSGAGHQYPYLVLTNSGTTTCTVRGYPGVSFVATDGSQLGAAATREAAGIAITTLTLAPGAAAHSQLSIANAGNYDAATCNPKPAAGLRVYPPNETNSILAPSSGLTACQNASVLLLTVRPLQAGAA